MDKYYTKSETDYSDFYSAPESRERRIVEAVRRIEALENSTVNLIEERLNQLEHKLKYKGVEKLGDLADDGCINEIKIKVNSIEDQIIDLSNQMNRSLVNKCLYHEQIASLEEEMTHTKKAYLKVLQGELGRLKVELDNYGNPDLKENNCDKDEKDTEKLQDKAIMAVVDDDSKKKIKRKPRLLRVKPLLGKKTKFTYP